MTALAFLGEGDELDVHRLHWLGRSKRDVLNVVHEFDAKGASLPVIEPEVTTAGDMGRTVITGGRPGVEVHPGPPARGDQGGEG